MLQRDAVVGRQILGYLAILFGSFSSPIVYTVTWQCMSGVCFFVTHTRDAVVGRWTKAGNHQRHVHRQEMSAHQRRPATPRMPQTALHADTSHKRQPALQGVHRQQTRTVHEWRTKTVSATSQLRFLNFRINYSFTMNTVQSFRPSWYSARTLPEKPNEAFQSTQAQKTS